MWSYDSGSEIESSPAISRDDGTLYVGLVQDKVIAINTAAGPLSGKLKWSADAGGEVVSSPVLTEDGRVSCYFRSIGTHVFSFSRPVSQLLSLR